MPVGIVLYPEQLDRSDLVESLVPSFPDFSNAARANLVEQSICSNE